MLLATLLRRIVRTGTIVVIAANGRSEAIVASASPCVTIRLTRRTTALKLALAPNFFLGESYMRGELLIEQGDLRALLGILLQSIDDNAQPTIFDKLRGLLSPLFDRLLRIGTIRRARPHVQSHYDRSEKLFESFLDPARQYSCAYFPSIVRADDTPLESIAEAQIAKMRHIAAKLRLMPAGNRPGPAISAPCRLLDIGSGWGGLAEFLCSTYPNLHVTGITLSENQCRFSQDRQLTRAEFHLRDYRQEQGPYDRVVSVGMLEHVGCGRYDEYFSKVNAILKEDGVALVHTIARRGVPQPINIWMRRRIFPGAYLPSLSQLAAALERTGLWILDCENLRIHYAKTLRCWHERLLAIKDQFDEQFYRMWEFYLVACEMGFLYQGLTVYQLLLGKHPDAAPLTRDFMHEEEQRLQGEAESGPARRPIRAARDRPRVPQAGD
jgi:cyclopropane-fatty-acyl-phospholipid synthase